MDVLAIHPSDNAIVATQHLTKGRRVIVGGRAVNLTQNIPAKHKFAARALAAGDSITMYGVTVGRAIEPIAEGARLTTGNVKHAAGAYRVRNAPYVWEPPSVTCWQDRTFLGYHRSDGQVGTANHWLVIPLVFCENRNVKMLRDAFECELGYAPKSAYRQQVADLVLRLRSGEDLTVQSELPPDVADVARVFKRVDGIRFLTHEGGCGCTRQDARGLCGLFAGYLHHPNVAGATVLSLGCENAQMIILQEEIHQRNPDFDKPVLFYEQQRWRSVHTLLSDAVERTFRALVEANRLRREPSPLNRLTIGLECGGSDGFSGLSANPAMGHASDLLVALGGRAILAEFPELCGVEQALIDRCVTKRTAARFADLMGAYASAAERSGSGFDMNPSPGNIRDGLLTDAMKSAGAARKGGTSPITAVLDYPEYAVTPGLNLLCTPGSDVESTTALAGAGAQVILFSTGMGTPTGNPAAQVVKISSNTSLKERLPDLIDVDAGGMISGIETMEDVGARILETIVQVASGRYVTQASRLRQYDFIPWKRGVSL